MKRWSGIFAVISVIVLAVVVARAQQPNTQSGNDGAWHDRATGAEIPMWDMWLNDPAFPATYRLGLRPVKENPDLQPIIQAVGTPLLQDQYEKTADYEQRKQRSEVALQQLLSKPLLFPAVRDTDLRPDGFVYDADREVIQALLPMQVARDDRQRMILPQPYEQMLVRVPAADVIRAPRVTRPVNGEQGFMGDPDLYCGFPLPVDEAKARVKNLSVLYSVRVRSTGTTRVADERVGTLPDRNLPGVLPDRAVRVSSSRGVVVIETAMTQVDVWLVDRVKRERLAVLPLAQCAVTLK